MDDLWIVVVNALIVFTSVIVYTRLFGLRSFTKLTNFDFAVTIAIGSIAASGIINTQRSVLYCLVALLSLYLLKLITAYFQSRYKAVNDLIANEPVLFVRDGVIDYETMDRVKINKDELYSKLREANVLKMSDVRAVVLETTGDISVLHGDELEEELLFGVSNVQV